MGERRQDGFQAALSCEHRQPEKPSCPTILPVIFILPAHGLQASRRGAGQAFSGCYDCTRVSGCLWWEIIGA
ncbi:hypothetical protein [Kingella oralis]|uniref:hypothetical protein n=1 Tax=Kingella oralis TaxID=505 RepID=UPI0012DBDA09|nr:hypothetical protein [Kingella oralis]QMT42929.1 hypothetical protein H3L93_00705 [Kingella oralis]